MTAQDKIAQAQIFLANRNFAEAEKICRDMLTADPAHAGALNLATSIAQASSSLTYRAELYFLAGSSRHRAGQLTEALADYDRAAVYNPDYGHNWANRGIVLRLLGRLNEARTSHVRAIECNPDEPGYYFNLANLLSEHNDIHGSVEYYRQAMVRLEATGIKDPQLYLSVVNNMGMLVASRFGDYTAAANLFNMALRVHPHEPQTLNNLGTCLCHQGHFEEGAECFARVLGQYPQDKNALNNMGNTLRALCRSGDSIAIYRQLLKLYPDCIDGRYNYAMVLLQNGQFAEGWAEYEMRWQTQQLGFTRRDFTQPMWQGEAGNGRMLLVHSEQGYGDTLQFARYVTLAAQRDWRVVLEVQPPLKRLMQSLDGVETVVARGEPLPPFDLHCATLSLPHVLQTTPETIPAILPYLHAEAAEVELWQKKLPAPQKATRRVGVVWTGLSRRYAAELIAVNQRRSIDPDLLMPLLAMPGVQFFSLQKDEAATAERLGLIDHMADCNDFADTAALIMNLDLVISVDTAVAHLAAALGKPVWLLNRYDTCWRWLENRDDTAWYPGMRIFRQRRSGEWRPVIERVRQELSALI